MNANELADELERFESFNGDVFFGTCAVMLRQQQAEIEALKMDIHSLTYGERLTKYFNKPVAYIDPYDLERLPHYDCHIGSQQLKNGIPLYTHPVKELTDEEILGCWVEEFTGNALPSIDFARAILRKAQEK